MKKLQNTYTTPEQSKRLLELGVPADSADLKYWEGHKITDKDIPLLLCPEIPYSKSNMEFNNLPCWTVGRLIEIALICGPHWKFLKLIQACFQVMFHYKKPYVEAIIEQLFNAKDFKLDYSKLEE